MTLTPLRFLSMWLYLCLTSLYPGNCDKTYYCHGFAYCPDTCLRRANYADVPELKYCIECLCPEGHESLMQNYVLIPCDIEETCWEAFNDRKIIATCKHGYCQCPEGSRMVPHGKECLKIPSKPADQCFFHRTYLLDCDDESLTCNMDSTSRFYTKCTCSPGYYRESITKTCKAVTSGVIGANCRYNEDCTVPYSTCINKFCACREGFDLFGQSCEPKERYCPGNSVSTPAVGKACFTYYLKRNEEVDNCGTNEFCFTDHKTLAPNSSWDGIIKIGHCCEMPRIGDDLRLACPYNEIQRGHRCPLAHGNQLEQLGNCPSPEYNCVTQKYRADQACCLSPCNNVKAFIVSNRCLLPLNNGEECEHKLQCPLDALCAGVCTCKEGFTSINSKCVISTTLL